MQLLDVLSKRDKTKYQTYIQKALNISNINVNKSLTYWNKNKRKMYKVLGGKLRLSIPVEVKVEQHVLAQKLSKLLPKMYSYSPRDFFKVNKMLRRTNNFPYRFAEYLNSQSCLNRDNMRNFTFLFMERNLLSGHICLNEPIEFLGMKICNGARTIKTIGKLVRKTGYDEKDFEEWRNKISDITTTQSIKQTLTLSIHPLDFLSLSDNDNGWDSCYSLLKRNMHFEAPITHMNSNCVIVAYLESKKPFEVAEDCIIPNKTYRQLFYVHKNIICGGRAYPYESVELTKKIIDILKGLVYNNLGWKYQYKCQNYYDDFHFSCNNRILEEQEWYGSQRLHTYHHHIYLYTGREEGYNDLVEHRDENFYCVRNWVPKDQYICTTGPTTCINCGEIVRENYYYKTNHLLCPECAESKVCDCCREIKKMSKVTVFSVDGVTDKFYKKNICVCQDCLENSYVFVKEIQGYMSINIFLHSHYREAFQKFFNKTSVTIIEFYPEEASNTYIALIKRDFLKQLKEDEGGIYRLEFSDSVQTE